MAGAAIDIRIKVLGWIHVIVGGGLLAIGTYICAGLAQQPDDRALYYVGPLFTMFALVFLIPSLIGGWALLAGKRWAWVFVGVLSVLLLLVVPIGTALGAYGLWAVFSAKPPQAVPIPTEVLSAETRRISGLLMVATIVGCGFIVVIGGGYRLHGESAPPPIGGAFWPALALLIAMIGFVVVKRPFAEFPDQRPMNPLARLALRRRLEAENKAADAAHRERLARLDADPLRRTYAARMRMGDYWSDEQIDYDLDPDRLVTCSHLQPIERAMRRAGLPVKFSMASVVNCACQVDEAQFLAQFDPAPSVAYREFFQGGRAVEDFPTAQISCAEDRSVILVLHPLEARPDTPWFPGPPAA